MMYRAEPDVLKIQCEPHREHTQISNLAAIKVVCEPGDFGEAVVFRRLSVLQSLVCGEKAVMCTIALRGM